MRFLLVLSAFLTALVGLGAGVPTMARPASEVSAPAAARPERKTIPVVAVSPLESAVLDRVNFGPVSLESAPARSVPLYAERLRV